ncbi:tyrosine-protein phosphatase non-receptor type 9 isoform X3 [Emydura macquarii macquarii]|uniref:tyrosine-protein phosphatase non-receptor type 9 isoform X3 n=1 Tax=Emydura macquarii macquarii TaxID=1129001 RepID=UPI00352A279B
MKSRQSARDPSGASIALFTAKLHHPNKSVQHVVLQALFYLLDRAVESFETQRNGLVFIYDMAGSHYTNFELDLSKKILNLLKGAFPARLKKVFIVGAPMWFRVPYSIISLLLKEKLRERVQMVKMSELKEHLPRECLPEYLGGTLKLDPVSWNCRFLPQQNGHPDPLDELILVPLVSPRDNGSVHVPGPKCMTVQQLMDHVNRKQKRGIYEEYEDIRCRSPAGTFICSLAPYNQEKNRYGDVPCLDQTRVKLTKPHSRSELTDYINASFMDGYKQRNAYIGTQGPLENTYCDFWRMVWEQNILVIVMTTRLEEGGRRKCGQYWPLEKDFRVCYGSLTVTNLGVENLNHYKKTLLEIYDTEREASGVPFPVLELAGLRRPVFSCHSDRLPGGSQATAEGGGQCPGASLQRPHRRAAYGGPLQRWHRPDRYLLRTGHLPLPAPGHGHAQRVPDRDADENAESLQHPDPRAVLFLLHCHHGARSERGPATLQSHVGRPGEELIGTQPSSMAGTGSPISHDQPAFLTTSLDSAEPSGCHR